MMFTASTHCHSRAHCRTCRSDAGWRVSVKAPEVCPFGVTLDRLPDRPAPESGAGTELKRMLATVGIIATPSCGCHAMLLKMNLLGPAWCEANTEEIVAVMTKEAESRGWLKIAPFKALGARFLVRKAIAAARG